MFTPLHRRLQRKSTEIKGTSIIKFLKNLFNNRLERHNVKITATANFRKAKLLGYTATFYPVFVNLVDNSIYWLKDHPGSRNIKLDFENGAFFISDNGPGIENRDKEAVFEWGFSRKPFGRGLGLYISQQVLSKEGYRLELVEDTGRNGATFKISAKKNVSH